RCIVAHAALDRRRFDALRGERRRSNRQPSGARHGDLLLRLRAPTFPRRAVAGADHIAAEEGEMRVVSLAEDGLSLRTVGALRPARELARGVDATGPICTDRDVDELAPGLLRPLAPTFRFARGVQPARFAAAAREQYERPWERSLRDVLVRAP